jgi:hypothetical protein
MGFENLDHWNTHFRIDDLKILQTFDLWLWPVTTWSWPMYIMTWSWPNLKVTFRMGELDKIATNVFLHIKPSVKIWWNLFLAAWVDHVTGNQSWKFLKITEKNNCLRKPVITGNKIHHCVLAQDSYNQLRAQRRLSQTISYILLSCWLDSQSKPTHYVHTCSGAPELTVCKDHLLVPCLVLVENMLHLMPN